MPGLFVALFANAPFAQNCDAGILLTTDTVTFTCDASGDTTVTLEVAGEEVPAGGDFGWFFDPGDTGTGALGGQFILNAADNPATYDEDLNGVLSLNGFPPLSGVWVIRGAVYSDANSSFNSICDTTEDSIIVSFTPYIDSLVDDGGGAATVTAEAGTEPYTYLWSDGQTAATATGLDPAVYEVTVTDATGCEISGEIGVGGVSTCVAGELTSTLNQTICPGDSAQLFTDGSAVVPSGGGQAWLFSNAPGGTGGPNNDFTLFGISGNEVYDAGLNGILAINGAPPLEGLWTVQAAVYEDSNNATGTICDTSQDTILVNFLTTDDVVSVDGVVDNGDSSATVSASGGLMPYTYLWSDGQTAATATGLIQGSYTVTVTDANGCTDDGSVTVGVVVDDACLEWQIPTDSTGYTSFNESGGAPCDDGSGCPTVAATQVEVTPGTAFEVDSFQVDGVYTFTICQGPNAGSWVPDFTIITPSGAVDAFGLGDGCSITWTASESGTYTILINEAGNCGNTEGNSTSNGIAALTCEDGTTECAIPGCNVGEILNTEAVSLCSDSATFRLTVDSTDVSIPPNGGFGWFFSNQSTDGTGGLNDLFILTDADYDVRFDSDLNGILSSNDYPMLEGTWEIAPAVYDNFNDPFNSICDLGFLLLEVTFASESPVIDEITAGDGTASVTVSGGEPPYSYEWSDGQTTATATGLAAGEYTVTVTDANGCTVTGTVDVMVSTASLDGVSSFYFGPNPTTGTIDLTLRMETAVAVGIEIEDLSGRRLMYMEEDATTTLQRALDLSSYANGVYILRIITEKGQLTKPLVLSE